MRYIILILFMTLMSHGQTATPTVTNSQSFHPILINTPGTSSTPDGRWRIGIVRDGQHPNLAFHELQEDGWSASAYDIIDPNPWEPHPSWFIFVESESKAWAYDGDRLLILRIETPGKSATYSGRFPSTVPPEVFSRLSEALQKDVTKYN